MDALYSRMQNWAREISQRDETGKFADLCAPFLATPSVKIFILGFSQQEEVQKLIQAMRGADEDEQTNAAKSCIDLMAKNHEIDLTQYEKHVPRLLKYLKLFANECT